MKPLLITIGDPAGIGAEVALKALQQEAAERQPIILVGNEKIWKRAADMLGMTIASITELSQPLPSMGYAVWSPEETPLDTQMDLSDPDDRHLAERGRIQLSSILPAVKACLDGKAAGLVTMPIDKRALSAAGSKHKGHTELIAELCGVAHPVMMLFGEDLRVVPLTTHVPYTEVPQYLQPRLILETIRIVHHDLQRLFGIQSPRLAVCGLNPHAGEGGLLGQEEITLFGPALEAARRVGINVDGPLPADSAFAFRKRFDAILCPTHDQALIPLKQLHFRSGVNTTLGLPIIRTSPDHGTARDIAWQNKADACSASHAIRAAIDFAERLGSN